MLVALVVAGALVGLTLNPVQAEVVDRIVAIVNNDIITLFELDQSLEPFIERVKMAQYPPAVERQVIFKLRQDVLNQLIDQKLTEQQIRRTRTEVSVAEIDQAIERFKEINYYTDEELRALIATEGITMAQYRENIKEQLLQTKLVNYEIKSRIVITQEDIQAYYEEHRDEYQGETQYHLRNIVMRVPEMASESEKQAVRTKMEDVLARLQAGEAFAELARQFSESPLAAKGGDLGLLDLGVISPQLQTALKGVPPGAFTPIIETDQGFQIFKIEDIVVAEGKPLEDVAEEIESKLFASVVEQRFRTWLEELRQKSHIKIIQ